jgi:hypothetical protein
VEFLANDELSIVLASPTNWTSRTDTTGANAP